MAYIAYSSEDNRVMHIGALTRDFTGVQVRGGGMTTSVPDRCRQMLAIDMAAQKNGRCHDCQRSARLHVGEVAGLPSNHTESTQKSTLRHVYKVLQTLALPTLASDVTSRSSCLRLHHALLDCG